MYDTDTGHRSARLRNGRRLEMPADTPGLAAVRDAERDAEVGDLLGFVSVSGKDYAVYRAACGFACACEFLAVRV